ncbi:uncharacterized protein FIBRA_08128 [Fibroporia radiculosa]|uniref:Cyclin N-terminal domain-containing protein n=1 Tax=Fibroporia radiculosa TaxID=599839 RepID=J4GW96_9APHY|nr:uncharacterized protein FIBRA_08128 [Fibroporia radiculosa]CCM05890.1 predicted protein [Fibroporia radiculosa]
MLAGRNRNHVALNVSDELFGGISAFTTSVRCATRRQLNITAEINPSKCCPDITHYEFLPQPTTDLRELSHLVSGRDPTSNNLSLLKLWHEAETPLTQHRPRSAERRTVPVPRFCRKEENFADDDVDSMLKIILWSLSYNAAPIMLARCDHASKHLGDANRLSLPPRTLPLFIGDVLRLWRGEKMVVWTTLYILDKLREPGPGEPGQGSEAVPPDGLHSLFLAAFLIAMKFLCDDADVGLFRKLESFMPSYRTLDESELQVCVTLRWLFDIHPQKLDVFKQKLEQDFAHVSRLPSLNGYLQPRPDSSSCDSEPWLSMDNVGGCLVKSDLMDAHRSWETIEQDMQASLDRTTSESLSSIRSSRRRSGAWILDAPPGGDIAGPFSSVIDPVIPDLPPGWMHPLVPAIEFSALQLAEASSSVSRVHEPPRKVGMERGEPPRSYTSTGMRRTSLPLTQNEISGITQQLHTLEAKSPGCRPLDALIISPSLESSPVIPPIFSDRSYPPGIRMKDNASITSRASPKTITADGQVVHELRREAPRMVPSRRIASPGSFHAPIRSPGPQHTEATPIVPPKYQTTPPVIPPRYPPMTPPVIPPRRSGISYAR